MRTLADIVPLRTDACRQAVDQVAQVATGERALESSAHVASCVRCQAEVAAYRRILRTMRSMRSDLVAPPPEGLTTVLAALEGIGEDGTLPSWAMRVAYVGGLTAASAAGVLVWYSRRRLGLLSAS